jgi:hypothetical protein
MFVVFTGSASLGCALMAISSFIVQGHQLCAEHDKGLVSGFL